MFSLIVNVSDYTTQLYFPNNYIVRRATLTGFSVYLGQPLDEAYIKRMIKQGYQMILHLYKYQKKMTRQNIIISQNYSIY